MEAARTLVFADRLAAIVEEIDPRCSRPLLLPGPQAVPVVAVGLEGAVGGQPVLRVIGQRDTLVGRRVALPVVAVAHIARLVVGVEGAGRSLKPVELSLKLI